MPAFLVIVQNDFLLLGGTVLEPGHHLPRMCWIATLVFVAGNNPFNLFADLFCGFAFIAKPISFFSP